MPMKLPRFNLRDLFWLVLVCALAVGWWVRERQVVRELEEASWAWDVIVAYADGETRESIINILEEHYSSSPYATRLKSDD